MVNSNRRTLAKMILPLLIAMLATLGALYFLGFSGAGAAPLSSTPAWSDCTKALYVANEGNGGGGDTIARVDCNGNISTFAGGFNGTSGLATDGTYLYVSDDSPGIFRISATGQKTKLTGATLENPNGLAIDSQGRLLVADSAGKIWRLTINQAAGTVSPQQLATGFSNSQGVAEGTSGATAGHVLFTDSSGKIWNIPPPSATLYKDIKFNSRAQIFTGDDACLAEWNQATGGDHVGTNRASSIKVSPGTKVILYDECDFKGKSVTYLANDDDLQDDTWDGDTNSPNDKVSSLRVSSLKVSSDTSFLGVGAIVPGTQSHIAVDSAGVIYVSNFGDEIYAVGTGGATSSVYVDISANAQCASGQSGGPVSPSFRGLAVAPGGTMLAASGYCTDALYMFTGSPGGHTTLPAPFAQNPSGALDSPHFNGPFGLVFWNANAKSPQPTERAACNGVGTGPTLYVDVNSTSTDAPDGSTANPYKTIQDAVNAAGVNTTIKVKGGIYKEHVNIAKSGLALMGMASGAETVIDGSGTTPYAVRVDQSVSNLTISHFRIEAAHTDGGGASGIIIYGSSEPRGIEICNNVIKGNDRGVSPQGTSPLVANNTFYGNTLGIGIADINSKGIYKNNIFASNTNAISAVSQGSGSKVLSEVSWNLFFDNTVDFSGVAACSPNCIFDSDPLLVNPAGQNYHIKPGSPAIDTAARVIDAAAGIHAPNQDMDFRPRPMDGNGDGVAKVDIGADELHATPPPPNTPKVKLVPRGQPHIDLSSNPLIIPNVGDMVEVDLLVELPAGESIYAAEFHLVSNDSNNVFRLVDAKIEIPGKQAHLSGDGLALTPLEPLRLSVVGFPDNGSDLRDCAGAPPSSGVGNDSWYTFVKGATGDHQKVPLQLLSQKNTGDWGGVWCGPTAAGISLAWFAETNPQLGKLIPDGDAYQAIDKLGTLMKTSSGDGTTDDNFIKGIVEYINGRGHTGDFKVKVYNTPRFGEYAHELDTGDGDVLVGITYTTGDLKGKGHWLVGRSFGPKNDGGTPTDPSDDFSPVSFVDPWTGSVYHSIMRPTPTRGMTIWYNGQWVDFDIMVSVSPVPPEKKPNDTTAQYFVARNSFTGINPVTGTGQGSVIFTLLGDPGGANRRTDPLTPGPDGRLTLVRLQLVATNTGVADIHFKNTQGGPAIQLVKVVKGEAVHIPQVTSSGPAARIVVGATTQVAVKLQSPDTRPNPQGWENMPLEIKIFPPSSGGMPTGTPVAKFSCPRLSRQGGFGVCSVPNSLTGTFDVFVGSVRTLVQVKRHVQLPSRVEFQKPLTEGDLNGDNKVNVQDFSLWVNTWRQKSTVTPERTIQDYSHGDLDKSGEVDIDDFGIFAGNYRREGPVEDNQVVVPLTPENLTGQEQEPKQNGHAILTQLGPNLLVQVKVNPPRQDPQPNHIHTGQCGPTLVGVAKPLTNVVNGFGETLLNNVTIASLMDGNHAINVHKSGAQTNVYTSCGNIPSNN